MSCIWNEVKKFEIYLPFFYEPCLRNKLDGTYVGQNLYTSFTSNEETQAQVEVRLGKIKKIPR